MLNKNKKNIFLVAAALIAILVASLPLLEDGMLAGHDIWYHLLRIENIKIGLEEGVFPVKVGPMYLNYHGYAASLCYPDIFLYFPAVLRLLGVGIMDSYKWYLFANIVLCYVTAFYCGKRISKDTTAATITAVLYTLCQYHICTLHTRAAVGEIQAFMFYPLVVCGLYDLIFEDFEHPFIMGLGYWGLMLCHSISLALALGISVVAVLTRFKQVVLNWEKMKKLLITAGVTLLASISFWLPFLEQLMSDTFYFSHPWADVTVMALSLKRLLSIELDIYNFGLGFLVLLLARVMLHKKLGSREDRAKADWFLIGGLLLLWATTKYFPWSVVKPVLNSIQFPFRLYTLAALFLSIGISMVFAKGWGTYKSILLILLIMTVSSLNFYQNSTTELVVLEDTYYDEPGNSFNVYFKEWLPDDVDIELLRGERLVQNSDGTTTTVLTDGSGEICFVPKSNIKYYDVPMVWYNGCEAYTILEDGSRNDLVIEKSDNNGLARVWAEKDMGQDIIVRYGGTKIQTIAAVLNGATLIALGVYGVKRKYKKPASDQRK